MQRIVASCNARVVVAPDGLAAVDEYREDPTFSLILLDIEMPVRPSRRPAPPPLPLPRLARPRLPESADAHACSTHTYSSGFAGQPSLRWAGPASKEQSSPLQLQPGSAAVPFFVTFFLA